MSATKHDTTARKGRSTIALFLIACASLLLSTFASGTSFAQPMPPTAPTGTPVDNELPRQLEDIGIEDKAGAPIPRDIPLVHSSGASFKLGEMLDGEKPLVIVMAYYGCPMLCSLVLNGIVEGMKGSALTAGKDYRLLVVSFDPRDEQAIAKSKRDNYAAAYGHPELGVLDFDFAVGKEADVARLASSLGFRFRWDEKTEQYAHAAGAFVLTPDGKLSQTLTGITFAPADFDGALREASRGVWHSPLKSVLLYCFSYDSMSGSYVPIVRNIMKVGAGITVLILGFVLLRLFRAKPSNPSVPPSPLSQGSA